MVQRKEVHVQYLPTHEKIADIFTKPLAKTKFEYFRERIGLVENASLGERECWWLQCHETSSRTHTEWVGLWESPWVGCAHEMGVSFLSKTEMECCVPLCGEDAHEMGVSFEMKQCVPLWGVKDPMWWVYYSPVCREMRRCFTPYDWLMRLNEIDICWVWRPYGQAWLYVILVAEN